MEATFPATDIERQLALTLACELLGARRLPDDYPDPGWAYVVPESTRKSPEWRFVNERELLRLAMLLVRYSDKIESDPVIRRIVVNHWAATDETTHTIDQVTVQRLKLRVFR